MRPSVTMSVIVAVRGFRSRHMCYIAGHVAWLSRTQATTTTIRVESLSFAGVLSVALTGMAAWRGVQAAVAVCACECGSSGEGEGGKRAWVGAAAGTGKRAWKLQQEERRTWDAWECVEKVHT